MDKSLDSMTDLEKLQELNRLALDAALRQARRPEPFSNRHPGLIILAGATAGATLVMIGVVVGLRLLG